MKTPILKTGVLAYLDTLCNGLVPLKVIRVERDHRQDGKPVAHVVARITADRGAYKRGEVVTTESAVRIVPRDAVRRLRGQVFPRIYPYSVEVDQ